MLLNCASVPACHSKCRCLDNALPGRLAHPTHQCSQREVLAPLSPAKQGGGGGWVFSQSSWGWATLRHWSSCPKESTPAPPGAVRHSDHTATFRSIWTGSKFP